MKPDKVKCILLVPVMILLMSRIDIRAGVSLKNGNFFMGYTDIAYAGGFKPKLERVYNSKSMYKSIFGWGWGMEYDVYLTVAPDGSVIVHEYGGGARNIFTAETVTKEALDSIVASIFNAAKENRGYENKEEGSYRDRLRADATFRNDEWDRYVKLQLLPARDVPIGAVLRSNRFSAQTVKRVRDGFVRLFDNGRREQYDHRGRLARAFDRNGNYVNLSYDDDGYLHSIIDNLGRKIIFALNDRGLVEKIEGEKGQTAEYRYNDLDQLIYSKDVDNNAYQYDYDVRHNLTRIDYEDKTSLEVTYSSFEINENVESLKDRDGTKTYYRYRYPSGPKDHSRLIIEVEVTDGGAIPRVLSRNTYEYISRRDEDGTEWTHKLIQTVDGDTTVTEYNRDGAQIAIHRGNKVTPFEYDSNGRVTRKESEGIVTELRYDDSMGKVSLVKTYPKDNPGKVAWTEYEYSPNGNLLQAKDSSERLLKLEYDEMVRISKIIRKDGSYLSFVYNKGSKPVRISLTGRDGSVKGITITYGADGKVAEVDSSPGPEMSIEVKNALQELDILRPAGVKLSI